jgi:hypothetical protein
MQRLMAISDGHATARMDDYESYLDPSFREEFRASCVTSLYAGHYDPICDICEELDLLVNSHVAICSISTRTIAPPPHPVCLCPLFVVQAEFFCRQDPRHNRRRTAGGLRSARAAGRAGVPGGPGLAGMPLGPVDGPDQTCYFPHTTYSGS